MLASRRAPLARDLPPQLQVAATNGSLLTDSRGRKYIDFVMGCCVGNAGWRPVPIAKRIERFKGVLARSARDGVVPREAPQDQ